MDGSAFNNLGSAVGCALMALGSMVLIAGIGLGALLF